MLALIFFLFANSPVQAQIPASWQGNYLCEVNGSETPIQVQMQGNQLIVQGQALNAGLEDPLPCTNQKLTKTEGGAIYTLISSCGTDGVYRALILNRPDALEQYSMSTHIRQVAVDELNIRIRAKFSGMVEQDLAMNCWK